MEIHRLSKAKMDALLRGEVVDLRGEPSPFSIDPGPDLEPELLGDFKMRLVAAGSLVSPHLGVEQVTVH